MLDNMTMSNSVMSSPQRTGASLRKTNKPLMEKRRRARINDSLSQLKSLVIQSNKKDSSQFNKLEKADILELTVKHLRNLQNQQQQLPQVNNDVSLAGKYQAGFTECANEVIRYLGQSQGFTDDLKSRVVHHLANCIQLSSNIPYAKPLQPKTCVASPPVLTARPNISGQFVSGQIVQVVSGQFPSIKPAVAGNFPVNAPVSIAPRISLSSTPAYIPATIPSSTSTTTIPPSESQNVLKYTQPLRIQIPSVVSPIIIQANTTHQPSNQSNMVFKVNDAATQVIKVQDFPSQVPTQMTCHQQETMKSSLSSTSPSMERSMSPAAFISCQNSHKFYTLDSQYPDFLPRSRSYSLTSSSSETELSSPLNLSQSPQYCDHKELNAEYPISFCKQIPQASVQSTISSTHAATKDRLLLPISPSSHLTSVIVDGRKTVESHYMKYMHYIDEDRHYLIHHEGSTSPASSMGEERLWRPW